MICMFKAIHYCYAKYDSKFMKDYDKNNESSYIQCCDINNLYGWTMLLKLPIIKLLVDKRYFST